MSEEEIEAAKTPLYVRLPPSTIGKVKQHIKDVAKKTGLNVSFPAMMDSLLLLGLASNEARSWVENPDTDACAGEK